MGLEGRWAGQWVSDVNGHKGRLRCLVTPLEATRYRARFHAKYARVLSFSYTAELTLKQGPEQWNFEGSADLGKLAGGVYHYQGHVTETNFFSTYRSKYDRGTFRMTSVPSSTP